MKRFVVVWPLLAILVSCNQNLSSSANSESSFKHSIINGNPVTYGQSPAAKSVVTVELLDKNGKFVSLCTGTLLSENKVITAGHCFDTNVLKNFVKFNIVFTTDYFTGPPRARREGTVYYKHPQYYMSTDNTGTYPGIPHDIAIASFKGGIPEGYASVAFDTDTKADYTEESVTVYGFGRRVVYSGTRGESVLLSVGTLRKGEMIISPYGEFRDQYRLSPKSKYSICSGDSGGPQFYSKGDVLKIIGITGSAGVGRLANGMANCRESGFATKVAPASSWIQSVLRMR